jgi:hypothetical protein
MNKKDIKVFGDCKIFGNTKIHGNVDKIQIGGIRMSIEDWKVKGMDIAKEQGFTYEEIELINHIKALE